MQRESQKGDLQLCGDQDFIHQYSTEGWDSRVGTEVNSDEYGKKRTLFWGRRNIWEDYPLVGLKKL